MYLKHLFHNQLGLGLLFFQKFELLYSNERYSANCYRLVYFVCEHYTMNVKDYT